MKIISAIFLIVAISFSGSARAQVGTCGYSSSQLQTLINQTILAGVAGGVRAVTVNNDLNQMLDCLMNVDSYNSGALGALANALNTAGGLCTYGNCGGKTLTFSTTSEFQAALVNTAPLFTGAQFVTVEAVATPSTSYATCGVTYAWQSGSSGVYNAFSGVGGPVGANGTWVPQYSKSPEKSCEFGAVGDATFDYSTLAITGTDNTPALQAMIDYALQNSDATVCVSDGQYKTTDTLQLGWGNSLYDLSMTICSGGRPSYVGQSVYIYPTKTDRCALNIQGLRNAGIKGLAFVGQNASFPGSVPFPLPTTKAGFVMPSLIPTGSNPGGWQQHSAYAAVCIDAYSGVAPLDAYPNVTFPAWTGIVAQYGKDYSSDILIEDVATFGFPIAINASPNGTDQGDFIKVENLTCQNGVNCVALGSNQERNTELTNINAQLMYAIITNISTGELTGKLGGPISNISCGNCYELFDIGALGYSGPVTIKDIYAEGIVRIGGFVGGGTGTSGVTINGCDVRLYQSITGISPAALIETSNTPITIKNCEPNFGAFRIDTLVHGAGSPVTIDGGVFNG